MASWDQGGGCACGLNRECDCSYAKNGTGTLGIAAIAKDPAACTTTSGSIGHADYLLDPHADYLLDPHILKKGLKEINKELKEIKINEMLNPLKPTVDNSINYRYDEPRLLKELAEYIDATYGQHYAKDEVQMAEVLISVGHATGFNIGNILKYAQRYKKKGDRDEWRKDLMKVIHYTIIQLYAHDKGKE